jgi:DNA polymerase III subunit gamma/tau
MAHDELYKKYRPTELGQLFGQKTVVDQVQSWISRGSVPHALLLSGPSGVGKTTLSRILQRELKCGAIDFKELDAATDSGGIDDIREIKAKQTRSPIGGDCIIWLIDECHALSAAAWKGLLKVTEDTRERVYFIFCTTDPAKVPSTNRTRLAHLEFKPLNDGAIRCMLEDVCERADLSVEAEVITAIIDASNGSGRQAMVYLDQVYALDTEAAIAAIVPQADNPDTKSLVEAICRRQSFNLLLPKIKKVAETTTDWEGLRRFVLVWASGSALSGKGDVASMGIILEAFREPYFHTGKAGFVHSCILATVR